MLPFFPSDRGSEDFPPRDERAEADFIQHWDAGEDRESRAGRSLGRYGLGFALMSFSLMLACLTSVAWLVFTFSRNMQGVAILKEWDFVEETTIIWGMLVATGLICGIWPDEMWRRKTGFLLMMSLADVVLWSVDHCVVLHLSDAPMGHEYFRNMLGTALGWSEIILIAKLSAEIASELGEPAMEDFGRATRTLAMIGGGVWFLSFFMRTDWSAPVWPLRERPMNPAILLPMLIVHVIMTINLAQVAGSSLVASRLCRRAAADHRPSKRADDEFFGP